MASGPIAYEFRKSAREQVRASVDECHGRRLANLRVWELTRAGEYLPSKTKGLAVSVEQLPELEAAVQALRAQIAAHA